MKNWRKFISYKWDLLLLVAILCFGIYLLISERKSFLGTKKMRYEYPVAPCIKKLDGRDPAKFVRLIASFGFNDKIEHLNVFLFAFNGKNYSGNCLSPNSEGDAKLVETFVEVKEKEFDYPVHVKLSSNRTFGKATFSLLAIGFKGDTLGSIKKEIKMNLADWGYEHQTKLKIKENVTQNPPLATGAGSQPTM